MPFFSKNRNTRRGGVSREKGEKRKLRERGYFLEGTWGLIHWDWRPPAEV